MIPLNTDLNILYFGGSGGFYFFHYIILAGQHWCRFFKKHWWRFLNQKVTDFDTEFRGVFDSQWSVSKLNNWKLTETWPDNAQTAADTGPRPYKIFLSCNDPKQWQQLPGTKVLLYTDIQSQIRLSRAKKSSYAFIRMQQLLRDSVQFQGHQVLGDIESVAHLADHAVYLQDLVCRPEQVLDTAPTHQQQQFTQHWLSLHPKQLLHKIHLT